MYLHNHTKLRVVHFMRSASDGGKQGIAGQRKLLHDYLSRLGLTLVSEIRMYGISANGPKIAGTIRDLIERKAVANDFDAIVVSGLCRLSRGGATHLLALITSLADAGIDVITPSTGIISGRAIVE